MAEGSRRKFIVSAAGSGIPAAFARADARLHLSAVLNAVAGSPVRQPAADDLKSAVVLSVMAALLPSPSRCPSIVAPQNSNQLPSVSGTKS